MRKEKQLLLDEIQEKIETSNAFIVTKYRNFSATKSRQFRDLLAQTNGEFEVVRKRLFLKALENIGIKIDGDVLEGHVGIVFSKEDSVETSKTTLKFGESTESSIEILGGHFDGQFYHAEDVKAIAKLPGKKEMQAQFLGLLEAPLGQTLAAIDALLTSLPHCFENKSNQESENQ